MSPHTETKSGTKTEAVSENGATSEGGAFFLKVFAVSRWYDTCLVTWPGTQFSCKSIDPLEECIKRLQRNGYSRGAVLSNTFFLSVFQHNWLQFSMKSRVLLLDFNNTNTIHCPNLSRN